MWIFAVSLIVLALAAIALLALTWRHPKLGAYVGVPIAVIGALLMGVAPAPAPEPEHSCMPSPLGNFQTFDLTDLARPTGLALLGFAAACAALALASRAERLRAAGTV